MSHTIKQSATAKRASGPLHHKWTLLWQLTVREVKNRYRGSGLGLFWAVFTPLLSLAVYTFVFGTVFKSRWGGSTDAASPMEFAVILFSGLLVFQLFSDVVTRAPTLILGNSSYVKKIVFPLELLIPVIAGAAIFHALVSLAIIIPFVWFVFGEVHTTLIWLPLVLGSFMMMNIGLGWFLASLGTYIRDIGQAIGTITTALMFLSPIFFPVSAMPEWIRPALAFNPLTVPIDHMRRLLIFGEAPDFTSLGAYSAAALLVAICGYWWFQKTRKGFADVI